MTLRKLLALLLCFLMLLVAVGCGEAADIEDDDDDKSSKKSKTSVSTSVTGDGSTTTHTGKTTTSRDKDTTTHATTTTVAQGGTAVRLPDDELILGDWEADVALGRAMGAMSTEDNAMQYFDLQALNVIMAYRFNDDGTATMSMHVKDETAEELKTAFLDGMDEYLQAMMREGGYATPDKFCEAMGCASMDELRDKMAEMLAQLIVSSLDMITQDVTYRFADGYLYFADENGEEEQYNYTLTATRLLLNFAGELDEDNADAISALMPLTFKKV